MPVAPENESATNTIARFGNSIGFRFRWATEGLTGKEFNFRPHPTSMSMFEVIVHLNEMAFYGHKTFREIKKKSNSNKGFMEIRNETLEVYEALSNRLKEMDDSDLETSLVKRINPPATLSF
ncbi:MAG: hypothetical protein ACJA0U_003253 [Salibacteraceae bacterium]|jgi:hypothetical protein